jgi:glucosamine-6-phosphate deaminase
MNRSVLSLKREEKVPVTIFPDVTGVNKQVAHIIVDLVRQKAVEGKKAVLGLATGSSPIGVYQELIRYHKEEGVSFAHVVTFNLDEYFPMKKETEQSYWLFMHQNLFNHIDIKPENINIPDGTLAPEQVADFCANYEKKIADAGGLDLQLLGIGRTGHIGFNEPGSDEETVTRLITLDSITRTDAASDFFGVEHVPTRAITMGVKTVMSARQVVLVALGEGKSSIVAQSVEGDVTPLIPATYLQLHDNVHFYVDQAAGAGLSRSKCPWLYGSPEWTDQLVKQAVIWLADNTQKALLKLTDNDYNENGLQGLLADQGPAYNINLKVFRTIQQTITGWPGGKTPDRQQPGDRRRRFEDIYPKRVIVFSPHPDDDVISMGGTLIRLADQGHEVHIAYQTSGNIAVFDDDVVRYIDFLKYVSQEVNLAPEMANSLYKDVLTAFTKKAPGQIDPQLILKMKGFIRRSEARSGARASGVPDERTHFMDLPFYETGKVKKNPLSQVDIDMTKDLLNKIKPHQVYLAGDLSDPHGTHRVCLSAALRALTELKDEAWRQTCEVWLYRGAWQEWPVHQIEMAIPLSPQEVDRKRTAIFKHQSQKDRALFPGADSREFWQRAEQRNAGLAEHYNRLGLAEYQAMEAFVMWKG